MGVKLVISIFHISFFSSDVKIEANLTRLRFERLSWVQIETCVGWADFYKAAYYIVICFVLEELGRQKLIYIALSVLISLLHILRNNFCTLGWLSNLYCALPNSKCQGEPGAWDLTWGSRWPLGGRQNWIRRQRPSWDSIGARFFQTDKSTFLIL